MSGFVFNEKPIQIERGDGAYVYDDSGTEYLDMGASYACVPLGHKHPAVHSAVSEQLEKITYVQASYPNAERTALYDLLAKTAPDPIDKTWLCNSGTEANEAALKFARSATGNSKIVATMQGFHGRTMGALATTWKNKYKKPYEPLIGDVEFVPYDDSEALEEAVDEDTAAFIVEPVQGEGGINPTSDGYLEDAREITEDAGAALIFDEVQTGMGRTGALWNSQRAAVAPDMITAAKGLGNGLPIGATLCRDWIAEDYGSHASTFSGGPVISAAAGATVSTIIEDSVPGNAAVIGDYLLTELEAAIGDDVRDIRGEGLMIGVEVGRGANAALKKLALNHQVLALPAGRTVIRLLPPLTIDKDHADAVVDAMAEVVE
ncbi:N2-acetyl-L-lysine aminotransferase /acetylornithine aminotransferase [Haloarcula quadrata]|uniref:Putative [LysW]-aminoadipate semialdehyde/glutamate semialdehyde transaminase n=3 Tax=Haloarcula TaxID=2237 RepID=Q5UZ52_HALMA|nr:MULTISPECIES: aspartate aminotransferase family protein [Haloarcula]AAV47451.1 acetylornithine aminotransferase [Haloarcula marismortui ATCC 43049]EMA14507.1 acetylornithine aminotransferase [Haloarcula sinaiiensis ATCC 33800]NHX39838.1 aspartate aminotransferase family protein [Haloarcula sp. R1-2]QCP92155.1 aspartate aminotransferase family protein [Haloarcula marismortui ATCC 43049]QUJ71750.1 aspartate aminotransferase family protein [Haloarcula sinaiiensis ATCC 33800]